MEHFLRTSPAFLTVAVATDLTVSLRLATMVLAMVVCKCYYPTLHSLAFIQYLNTLLDTEYT